MNHPDVVEHQVLIAESLGKEGLEVLQQHAHVDVCLKLPLEELKAILPKYHALIVRSATQVDDALLEAGKNRDQTNQHGGSARCHVFLAGG